MLEQPLAGGFAEPVHGAQSTFRAVMNALANPGQPQPLGAMPDAPEGLAPQLAAVALTLCDHDTALWLDPALAESDVVLAWLRFHVAAPVTNDPGRAHFALVSGKDALPTLGRFALGTDEYPDRSTTIALMLPDLEGGPGMILRGPGIDGSARFSPLGLPDDFSSQWFTNRELFPRGVDLLLLAGGEVAGLPRTTRIAMEAD